MSQCLVIQLTIVGENREHIQQDIINLPLVSVWLLFSQQLRNRHDIDIWPSYNIGMKSANGPAHTVCLYFYFFLQDLTENKTSNT